MKYRCNKFTLYKLLIYGLINFQCFCLDIGHMSNGLYLTYSNRDFTHQPFLPCSLPPIYKSTGINWSATSLLKGISLLCGSRYRRKYHDESTNVSIVSVSRVASPPHLEQKSHNFFHNLTCRYSIIHTQKLDTEPEWGILFS